MKTLIMGSLLIGLLGGMEDNAHAMLCPTTDNVKVISKGGYGIRVTYTNCQGQRIVSDKIIGISGHSLSVKAAEGSLVFVNYADIAGDPVPFCKREVPVGKGIEITTWGTAWPHDQYCVSKDLPKE